MKKTLLIVTTIFAITQLTPVMAGKDLDKEICSQQPPLHYSPSHSCARKWGSKGAAKHQQSINKFLGNYKKFGGSGGAGGKIFDLTYSRRIKMN